MNIVLISVPHTGTWFTIRLFTSLGLKENGLTPSTVEDNTVYHGHMLKGTQVGAALRFAKDMPLVCPLRHPYRVEESWRRRKKDVSDMIECFQLYMEKFVPLNPYVMPVDSPRREEYLRDMANGLGLSLQTDWPVINGKQDTHDVDLSELSPSPAVVGLVEDMRPFLSRYYGEDSQAQSR